MPYPTTIAQAAQLFEEPRAMNGYEIAIAALICDLFEELAQMRRQVAALRSERKAQ